MREKRNIRYILFLVIGYSLIQSLIFFDIINPYWHQIIAFAGIVTISALGLNLIYGYTGQFSLGHAAFYGIGAYVSAFVTKSAAGGLGAGYHTLFLGLVLGGILSGLIAFLIGLPILRLRSDYLAIATLGFGIIVKVLFDNADILFPILGGSRGMTGIPRISNWTLVFIFTSLAIIILRNLVNSGIGRALCAIREDEVAAEAVGVNTTKYKTLGFVIGCLYAGVAGGLYAHLYAFLHPSNFDFLKSIDILLIVVLGGVGNISGTIIAAIIWTFFLEGLRVFLPEAVLDWRLVIYPVLLIIMMIFRPQGIFRKFEFPFLRAKI